MNAIEIAREGADEVDHCIGTGHQPREQIDLRDVSPHELDLAKIRQRLQREALVRMPRNHPQPRPACQQLLRYMLADKAVATKQDDELVGKDFSRA